MYVMQLNSYTTQRQAIMTKYCNDRFWHWKIVSPTCLK